MAKKPPPGARNRPPPRQNRLLAALPPADYKRITALLEVVTLKLKSVLHKPGEPIRHVYFPGNGFCSILTVLQDGNMVEVATIGNEGMVGASLVLDGSAPFSTSMVQGEGDTCYRMTAGAFRDEMNRRGPFYVLLMRFAQAFVGFVMQSTACNAVHSVEQRLARWLLMARDRMDADNFPLTQEFVAMMLGVTRPTVTVVAITLQRAGLIKYHRGHITILDGRKLEAASCECYRAATNMLLNVTDAVPVSYCVDRRGPMPRIHLVNPSAQSFGIAVITPRWLFVLAAATGTTWGTPRVVDETLEPLDLDTIEAGDVVGIGIHTGNARRGYEIGCEVRRRGAYAVFGGIHATLFPEEVLELGGAHAVVRGDGDLIWPRVVADCLAGRQLRLYEGGRIDGDQFVSARWDLLPARRYMFGSVQTVRGCPKHCSFCSVWRTDGQEPRQRAADRIVREVVELRRLGFRFIVLADDNFYPVTFDDLAQARRRADTSRLRELEALREERFELMAKLAELPDDLVFYTQITMEAAEDPAFLDAMKRARILGALVGVESVTRDGLKDVYKGFNLAGDELVARLREFRRHGVYILGSFIFGLPSDARDTFDLTVAMAEQADLTFAQFVLLTPFPGTVDFEKWAAEENRRGTNVDGVPVTQHWLIPEDRRPKVYTAHPTMSLEDIRIGTQRAWDRFYSWPRVWARSRVVQSLRARLAFVLVSKMYRQMYANTGMATDSARQQRSAQWARWLGTICQRHFMGRPMPGLAVPGDGAEPAVR